jgi:hypothetical protein
MVLKQSLSGHDMSITRYGGNQLCSSNIGRRSSTVTSSDGGSRAWPLPRSTYLRRALDVLTSPVLLAQDFLAHIINLLDGLHEATFCSHNDCQFDVALLRRAGILLNLTKAAGFSPHNKVRVQRRSSARLEWNLDPC